MKTGHGKIKGGAFERYCCKQLSLFITAGKREDVFWRSAMSGGRATLQLKNDIVNRAQSGDMTAIAPEGYALCDKCLFEYKDYADLDIPQGLLKGTGLLHKFWRDTQRAAARYNKVPVLIAKQNYLPSIVLCPPSLDFFRGFPVMSIHGWEADVYLFEAATLILRRPQGKTNNVRVRHSLPRQ